MNATDTHPPSSPPPRGPSGKLWLAMIGAFVVALVLGTLVGPRVWSGLSHALHRHEETGDGKTQYYTCSMHPYVLVPKPGLCPVCHMTLEPVDTSSLDDKVSIDPVIVQNIGVRIEPVATGPLTKSIRTVGTVDYAEPLVKDVSLKTGGFIEKLYVNQTGQFVKAGEPLFDLYSPDLYAAQEELLVAVRSGNAGMIESARTKLSYLDVSDEQIKSIEQSGKPTKTLTIRSPHTGAVIEKKAVEGMRIDAGMQAYRIADLSRVWVMATVYEYQLPYLQEGQSAVISLPYVPGQTFEGKVVYIYPYLNETLREVKVRLEFDNPKGFLKPGMFANVELNSTLAEDRVLAPRSAIIDTGKRQVAFVSLGNGRFEPRDVLVGAETESGVVEILEGLKPGEMIVTSGQFLIDSEASIQAARTRMLRGDLVADREKPVVQASTLVVPDAVSAELAKATDNYLTIGDLLAADKLEGFDALGTAIAQAIDAALKTPMPDQPHFWHEHDEAATIRGKALELTSVKDIEKARVVYADLSVALARLLKATGVPASLNKPVHQLHCPMYLKGQGGGTWLQAQETARNPYMTNMPECFDKREPLPVAAAQGGAK